MIKIAAKARFSFMFPADIKTAFEFYSDMERMVRYLMHIKIIDSLPECQYRLYYNTIELGTYHIHVYCDVQLQADLNKGCINIVSVENLPPIETEVTFNATTARGYYSSEAVFYDEGDETRVEYTLIMQATPPRPKGMRFMPGKMVNKIATNITNHRMREIAENFIETSIADFPRWQVEKELC
ncbi:MAG: DUF1997 domain-containing protein [Chloroflexi bacterium]|nr:DUF1997 domain-containing protein [Chloroflexota bacterium]